MHPEHRFPEAAVLDDLGKIGYIFLITFPTRSVVEVSGHGEAKRISGKGKM